MRVAAKLSLREASKLTGISHTFLMEIEGGTKSPTFEKVMQILGAYHADMQDFLRETGHLPQSVTKSSNGACHKVPVVSWVDAANWAGGKGRFESEDVEEWVESDAKGPHIFALHIQDDSMAPEFNEGEIIICSPHEIMSTGNYVIANNGSIETILRQYKKYNSAKVLQSTNAKYPDLILTKDLGYQIIGVVVEKKKRYK